MASGDVDIAMELLELLPRDYKNSLKYMDQCRTYDKLCKDGILLRQGILPVQKRLSEILCEDLVHSDIVKYADALVRNGYNVASLSSATLYTMEETMHVAEMNDGHRHLFTLYSEHNTPPMARLWIKCLFSIHRCAPVMACIRDKKPHPDGTAAENFKWKAGEVLLFSKGNEDEDEDPTKGDD